MNEQNLAELITDVIRDLLLGGVLISIIAGTWKMSGMHHGAISTMKSTNERAVTAINGLRESFASFCAKVEKHFDGNREAHEKIDAKLDGHGDRLAKVEQKVDDMCNPEKR
jgi:hypothetical protein